MAGKLRKHPTASIALPIGLSVGAAIVVVAVSLLVSMRETNSLALAKQRETVERVIQQHGFALARELKVQTFWSEGYENTRSRNVTWMHDFYGPYLERLLGYNRLYVLDGAEQPVYAYQDGASAETSQFESLRGRFGDLIAAVRAKGDSALERYRVAESVFDLGGGQTVVHRSVSDVRRVAGIPSTVVVVTIVPDTQQAGAIEDPPFLMIAINPLDENFLRQLGGNFGYRDLRWSDGADGEHASHTISGLDGSRAGLLAWEHDHPGWDQVRRMTPGLTIALILLVALATYLIHRSQHQARLLEANSRELELLNVTLERRVSERTRELEVTLENMAEGIVMVSEAGEVVVANARASDLLETGSQGDLTNLVNEIAREQTRQDRPEPAGEPAREVERPSGRILEVRCAKLGEGGAVMTFSDVSVLKRRREELEAATRVAEAANETKSQFLSTMSHEMRTPLNGVIGALELLGDTALSEKQSELVDIAVQSSEALLVHINDVLDFSKLEAGKLDLVAKPFDLNRLVKSVLEIVAPQAQMRGNRLDSEFHGTLPRYIVGDSVRVRQVLLNLVSNATKFTRNGTITVRVERAGGTDEQPLIDVAVVDTGIGIPQDRLKDLFQEFSMLDSSYTRRTNGTGLGLAISKRLIEAMGGTVGVNSVEGEGSTFWFRLALTSLLDAPQAETPAVTAAPAAPAKLRILLVDDNATNRLVGSRLLMSAGHSVDTANNGKEALDAASRDRFDVIFMDISMPEMDGIEATQRIRALAAPYCSVRIIALTANAIAGDREKFLDAGMDDYLSKPLRRADIEARLKAIPQSCSTDERAAAGATLAA